MSDSDSDVDDYTVTDVLLGYTTTSPKGDAISHLGGRPSWISSSTPPSATLAKCKVCKDPMVLLLQLNGDLPSFPSHERRLYLFTCRRKTCRRKDGSVRVIRSVRISESVPKLESKKAEVQPSKPAYIGDSLFGTQPSTSSASTNPFASGNPFSTGQGASGNPFSSGNPFAAAGLQTSELASKPPQTPSPAPVTSPTGTETLPQSFAAALSLNNTTPSATFGPAPPPEPWPQEDSLPPAYPVYYLDPDYEELDKAPSVEIPQQTMDLGIDDTPSGSGGGKEDKDVFESTLDSTFQKFADRLSQNPEQVLRYEFRGIPLLYSKKDVVGKLLSGAGKGRVGAAGGIPRCAACGAGRVFEMQLTPHAILELEREESGLEGMEWGTIIVGVCERDCQATGVDVGGVGYIEEWAGVQWEEQEVRR